MKKAFALLFAGLLFVSMPGCAKKVDKADEKVEGLELEGLPSLTGDDDASKAEQAK